MLPVFIHSSTFVISCISSGSYPAVTTLTWEQYHRAHRGKWVTNTPVKYHIYCILIKRPLSRDATHKFFRSNLATSIFNFNNFLHSWLLTLSWDRGPQVIAHGAANFLFRHGRLDGKERRLASQTLVGSLLLYHPRDITNTLLGTTVGHKYIYP